MRRIVFALALFLAPLSAGAEEESTVFDFRNGQVPGKWEVTNWPNVESTPLGLFIRANADGRIMHRLAISHPAERVRLTFANTNRPTEATLLWHKGGTPDGQLVQLPFFVRAETNPEWVEIDMMVYSEWDPWTDFLGIGLPAGAEVTLQEVAFLRSSLDEKIQEGFLAFWTFDEYRPYSINFLWGPQLVTSKSARDTLFDNLPPRSMSAVRLFYYTLAIAALILFVHRKLFDSRGRHLAWFAGIFAGLWIIFDLRMGLELLSYAKTDIETYVRAPAQQRVLRTFLGVYGAAETSLPHIKEDRYGFLIPPGNPIPALLRYLSYPRLPVTSGEPDPALRHWLVFLRDDVAVSGSGVLTVRGIPVSSPGKIVEQFGPQSFLFEANPAPQE